MLIGKNISSRKLGAQTWDRIEIDLHKICSIRWIPKISTETQDEKTVAAAWVLSERFQNVGLDSIHDSNVTG